MLRFYSLHLNGKPCSKDLDAEELPSGVMARSRSYHKNRHIGSAKIEKANADEVFEEVLAILWVSVVRLIFSKLGLKVTQSLYISNRFDNSLYL